jgi:serine/threonine protein kinase
LAERFQIERLLGRGGFSLAYLAKDRERGDEVVVKELAPAGLQRREDDVLELAGLGQTQAMHLRQRFLEEAVLLGRLNLRGLLPVRSSFSQNGTAYYATDYIAGVVTLDDMMRGEGQMHAQGALDLMYQLLETLRRYTAADTCIGISSLRTFSLPPGARQS